MGKKYILVEEEGSSGGGCIKAIVCILILWLAVYRYSQNKNDKNTAKPVTVDNLTDNPNKLDKSKMTVDVEVQKLYDDAEKERRKRLKIDQMDVQEDANKPLKDHNP